MCRVVQSLESFEDVTELSTVSREARTSKESNVVLFEGGTDTGTMRTLIGMEDPRIRDN